MSIEFESEHPITEVRGATNRYLEGKQIIVGLTGSVATYKAIDLIRWLIRRSAVTVPFATTEALRYVGVDLLEWASGVRPIVELTGQTEHISVVRASHAMVIAPATLSSLSKLAYGIADNNVVLTAISMLGYGKPVIVAPALHSSLASTPQYKEVIAKLESQGVVIVPPRLEGSRLVMEDPGVIGRVTASLACRGRDARGLSVLVTGGATREWIDEVRFISNASSGRMAYEIALEAWARGASVDFVSGLTSFRPPSFIRTTYVETTREMAETIARYTSDKKYDVIISVAAPLDFELEKRYEGKIPSDSLLQITMKPAVKVLEAVKQKPKILAVFTATPREDAEGLLNAGLEKLKKYDADIVIANTGRSSVKGFGAEELNALIAWKNGTSRYLGYIHKEVLARYVIDEILKLSKRIE